ncbi:MAG: 2-isopropylmalate synthase [Acutalibacteraceae bacterium]|nr:2-isopropylmalate synthase [Acutalibacteraceae bacterium]
MPKINEHTNLLEMELYGFSLQNPDEPNLFREIYPYDNVPVIPFNHRRVPENMPNNIWITDTSFRDGQQSIKPYTVQQMVTLYKLMNRLSGPKGIIRQTEFFVYSEKDREALEACRDLGYEFPEITTWIRARKEDYELVKNVGVRETGVLMSCSDYHIYKKLKMDRKKAIEHYKSIIYDIIENGIVPRCHLEDITRADMYGFVIPFAREIKKISEQSGMPIKIRACDTMGFGIPYSGVALPRSVPGIAYALNHHGGIPSEQLEWHGHNDFYKGVSNASAAWLYGISSVNCSLLGIGERTGNIPLEAMVFEYGAYRGTFDGMDTRVITEIADFYRNEIHYPIPDNMPFVGKRFNTTKAGIHADGLSKDEEIYNIFDTEKLLGAPPKVIVDNNSGVAGIAYWINSTYRLSKEAQIDKRDPMVLKIKEYIDEQYKNGRTAEISDEELAELVERCSPDDIIK